MKYLSKEESKFAHDISSMWDKPFKTMLTKEERWAIFLSTKDDTTPLSEMSIKARKERKHTVSKKDKCNVCEMMMTAPSHIKNPCK